MRPANLVTAVADILCGAFIAGIVLNTGFSSDLVLLCLSSASLYAGGVVLNDVFDASLDKRERPERPIPSGRVSKSAAAAQGGILLLSGVGLAFSVSVLSAIIAGFIAVAALSYDAFAKYHFFFGPVFMASCRAANLLLGISIIQEKVFTLWPLILIPFIYIFTVTFISRNEVTGIIRNRAAIAVAGYMAVLALIFTSPSAATVDITNAIPFLLAFVAFVFPPLVKLFYDGKAENVRKAVKAGVVGLILLNATLAAGHADMVHGLLIILLLPLTIGVAKYFAVT